MNTTHPQGTALYTLILASLSRQRLRPKLAHAVVLCMMCFTTIYSVTEAAVEPITVSGSQVLVGNEARGLAGTSYFWSNTGWGAERFYNANSVAWLKSDWNAQIVRAAMGVEDPGAYLQDPAGNKARVKAVVDAAIANDMYVIIDWHSHHAEDHQAAAVSFFTEMAQTYGQHNNVIYEIYNEPLQVSWSNTIKPYAEAVIGAIRAHDPDNLIVVGTPTWSQEVEQAADDPIQGYQNIAYTLHFYAGTHKQWLRDRAERAMNKGIALVVTEWGTVNASGDGAVDVAETNAWVDWMKQYQLTHLNWSLHDKNEGASILRPGVISEGNWGQSELTESGQFVRDIVLDYNGSPTGGGDNGGGSDTCPSVAVVSLPGMIQAEDFCQQSGVLTQATTDVGSGENIGWIDNGDWVEYKINVAAAGVYTASFRVASNTNGGTVSIVSGQSNLGQLTVENTGGWQSWTTATQQLDLAAGPQTLRLNFSGSGSGLLNLNYVDLQQASGGGDNGGGDNGGGDNGGGDNGGGDNGGGDNGGGDNGGGDNGGGDNGVTCEFLIDNEWNSGFVATIKISNNGSQTISGNWGVSFQFTDGSSFLNGWNGSFTGSELISVSPASWNASIQPGSSSSFGLQANKGQANLPAPTPLVSGSLCD